MTVWHVCECLWERDRDVEPLMAGRTVRATAAGKALACRKVGLV